MSPRNLNVAIIHGNMHTHTHTQALHFWLLIGLSEIKENLHLFKLRFGIFTFGLRASVGTPCEGCGLSHWWFLSPAAS